jgi:hypothetical protein
VKTSFISNSIYAACLPSPITFVHKLLIRLGKDCELRGLNSNNKSSAKYCQTTDFTEESNVLN